MVDKSQKLLSKPLDFLWTLPVIKRARLVLTLTDQEDSDILALVPGSKIERINNGVEIKTPPAYANRPNKVVFLSRLQQRKRPVVFVQMAEIVLRKHPEVEFEIAGSDEGELEAVREAVLQLGLKRQVKILGAINPEKTDSFLESARVMVLPSVGEIFPMVLLESFRAGTPSVVTESLGIVTDCISFALAEVTTGDAQSLASAVCKILEDDSLAEQLRENSKAYLELNLDIKKVAILLLQKYTKGLQTPND
jgi:glycosyltransferase involved in cell wall biosynthesis